MQQSRKRLSAHFYIAMGLIVIFLPLTYALLTGVFIIAAYVLQISLGIYLKFPPFILSIIQFSFSSTMRTLIMYGFSLGAMFCCIGWKRKQKK